MKNVKCAIIIAVSFVLLLVNPFTSLAQSSEDKWKLAGEFVGKGEAAFKDKNYSEAIENFTVAIGLVPNEASLYMRRGDAKLISRDNRGAITDYSRVIQLCSDAEAAAKARMAKGIGGVTNNDLFCNMPTAYLNRGIAKDRLGDRTGACADLRKACSEGNSDACKSSLQICEGKILSGTENGSISSSVQLTLGTYIAEASQATTNRDGFTMTDLLQIKIAIESIDKEGNVQAVIIKNMHKGNVSGRVNSEGRLQLEGSLFDPSRNEWKINLTATVKGTTLTAGKYTATSFRVKTTGEFDKAVLEK